MADFKIAAAQIASIAGDIDRNVAAHASVMIAAAKLGISVVVYPELSLTGYDLKRAADLALTCEDARLQPLEDLARRHGMTIIIGAPIKRGAGKPAIGAIVIGSGGDRKAYHKMHLGGEEEAFFASGDAPMQLTVGNHEVGIAICADASRESHPQGYATAGGTIYAASVFLTADWYPADARRLAGHARRHGLLTVMANHGASTTHLKSVGRSTIWRPDGTPLVQAGGTEDMLLVAAAANGGWNPESLRLSSSSSGWVASIES